MKYCVACCINHATGDGGDYRPVVEWLPPVMWRLLLLFVYACTPADPPPFTYRLVQFTPQLQTVVLDEFQFASYAEARDTGPYAVEVMDGSRNETIMLSIGFCQPLTCTGPLELEELTLSLDPRHPEHVQAYKCVGTDGSIYGGIDVSKFGDCAD